MKISLKATRLGLRNSTTRIPFRYGKACLTSCPQAVLQATVETSGKTSHGYSADCLPPSWFDKTAGKTYARQIEEMLDAIAVAEEIVGEELAAPGDLFPAWLTSYERVQARGAELGYTPLLASFGLSMVERALIDGLCRVAELPFAKALRQNLFQIAAGQVHQELADVAVAQWLPAHVAQTILVRHTVGLSDPLTRDEIPADERLHDGLPQALEEYLAQCGVRYLKIKVCNQLDHDLDRLTRVAEIVERHRGADYRITLDGNEQYPSAADFEALVESLQREPALATLWKNTIAIEQPLERGVALSAAETAGIRQLSTSKPVIIDESDATLDCYKQAVSLGYRGVSSKNCKGPFKSILNAGLTWLYNERGKRSDYLMTGEDLCAVGGVALQADLCLVATLGLQHVERNGHHYHRGLSYMEPADRLQIAAAHPDLYAVNGELVTPRLVDGRFEIASLQCSGFGFAVEPNMSSMQGPDEWTRCASS